jgi:hypothetical protein
MPEDETPHWTIAWDAGEARIQALGGMLGPVIFSLPDGRRVEPLARGWWSPADGAEYRALPPMIRHLCGEWPCVPFGMSRPQGLPEAWSVPPGEPVDSWPHGYGSNHEWSLVERAPDTLTIAIAYPSEHPVRRLQRTIRGIAGRAEIGIDLSVEMRRDFDLCLALHPVFRLPETAGQVAIEVEGAGGGRTYPIPPDSTSLARPDTAFQSLREVPAADGGVLDFTRLPTGLRNEELLQLVAGSGRVTLRNHAEAYAATLTYDPELFPTVMLWVANGGLAGYPWAGRFRALGVEPARAAFDLGQDVSARPDNPWLKAGVPTTIRLAAGERLSTSYSIGVEGL